MKEMINSFDQTKLLAPLKQERESYSLFMAANLGQWRTKGSVAIAKKTELVVEAVSKSPDRKNDETFIQS